MPRRAPRWWPLAALAALCLLHAAANLWWLRMDNHVVRVDEESHMEYARKYYEVFALNDYSSVVEAIVAIGNIRPKTMSHPPLLHILGGLQMSLFGYSVDALSFTNTYLLVLSIVGVFLLARRWCTRPGALFVAVVFSLTPIIFAGSRFFMTDYVSMALTVWAVYALVQSDGFRHTGWVLLFAVLNGLALLCRSVNFLYLLSPAVLVYALGLWQCRPAEGAGIYWAGLRRLAVHAAMTLVVTLGVAAPWYFRHADSIYDYWVTYRGGVTGAPIAGLDDARVPVASPGTAGAPAPVRAAEGGETAEAAPAKATPAHAAPVAPAAKPGLLKRVLNRFLYPPNGWLNYPVHLINNAMFLPLLLLALAGMAAVCVSRKLRRWDMAVLLAWVLGSWLLLQMTLRWSTPRYALQVVPALSIFAALAILSLPKGARRVAVALVLAWLGLQYVNMTFYSPAFLHRVELPVVLAQDVQRKYHDPGLAIIKDGIAASNAFRRMGTPENYNYKDELFGAMVRAEKTGPVRAGEFADYVRLGMLGMEWDERHYWPEPNPFLLPGTDLSALPRRKLRSVAMGDTVDSLGPYLKNADYVVYRSFTAEKEAAWIAQLESHGFYPIHQYNEPPIGADPPGYYGVLQKGGGSQLDLSTPDALEQLNVYDLHALLRTPGFARAKPEVQQAARQRYDQLLAQFRPFELTSQVSLLNATLVDLGGGVFRMRYLLKINKTIERDVGIYLIGRVAPEHYGLLPDDARAKGLDYFAWHLRPVPPASQWKAGGVELIFQDFKPAPVPHALMMGLETFDGDLVGRGADLGAVNFADITVPLAVESAQ
jgi:4-amino-4-deoxy-L-arabinose transferase-like glycosyltransferase